VVFAFATVASAVPVISGPTTIDVTAGSKITLTLSGTAAEATGDGGTPAGGYDGWIWVDYPAYKGQLSNVIRLIYGPVYPMGSGSVIEPSSLPNGFRFTAAPGEPWDEDTDVDVGPWFTFELGLDSSPTLGETYNVNMLDTGFSIIGGATHSVVVVPEPTTITLLGVGCLVLLRKRRS